MEVDNNTQCNITRLYGLNLMQYYIIWNCMYGLFFIPTVFGNGLIIYCILKFRQLRTKIHILIGNLAVADLLVGAVLMPLDTVGNFTSLNNTKYYCLIKLSFFTLSLGGSCFNLLLISIERFSSVVFPMRHAHFTKRKLLVVAGFGWLYVGVMAIMPLAGCNNWQDGVSSECNAGLVWGNFCKDLMNWNFVVAMVLNIVLFAIVVRIALQKSKVAALPNYVGVVSKYNRDRTKTITMACVLGMFALFWSPYAFLTFLISLFRSSGCTGLMFYIRRWCLLLGVCNSGVNWIIYGFRNREFREAFKSVLRCDTSNYRVRNLDLEDRGTQPIGSESGQG